MGGEGRGGEGGFDMECKIRAGSDRDKSVVNFVPEANSWVQ